MNAHIAQFNIIVFTFHGSLRQAGMRQCGWLPPLSRYCADHYQLSHILSFQKQG